MIGETILAGTSARCKQAYHRRDNMSLIIGLQSASWWSVNIYCANCWPKIGAPIIVPPILARSSAVSFNSANPTWELSNYSLAQYGEELKTGITLLGWHNYLEQQEMYSLCYRCRAIVYLVSCSSCRTVNIVYWVLWMPYTIVECV